MARPIKEIPENYVVDFKRIPERRWYVCRKCNQHAFVEANGKEYYHHKNCTLGNGIEYYGREGKIEI
jgi:hypothetical protein